MIMSPAGPINPRSTTPARAMLPYLDEIREAMREEKDGGGAGGE